MMAAMAAAAITTTTTTIATRSRELFCKQTRQPIQAHREQARGGGTKMQVPVGAILICAALICLPALHDGTCVAGAEAGRQEAPMAAGFASNSQSQEKLLELIGVVNDTRGLSELQRVQINGLLESAASKSSRADGMLPDQLPAPLRGIEIEKTNMLKRPLKEIEGNMSLSFEGESRSDPATHYTVLYNASTILVVKSANKYYYWTVSSQPASRLAWRAPGTPARVSMINLSQPSAF